MEKHRENHSGYGDIRKSPYAEFLEMLIGNIAELKPVKMAVVGMLPDGRAFTAQYGECDPYELALMAFHIQTDAIMDIVKANAGEIIRAAQEQEGNNEN